MVFQVQTSAEVDLEPERRIELRTFSLRVSPSSSALIHRRSKTGNFQLFLTSTIPLVFVKVRPVLGELVTQFVPFKEVNTRQISGQSRNV